MEHMMNYAYGRIGLSLMLLLVAAGCTSTQITTTARTAVEEGLLSQSAELTVDEFDFSALKGQRFLLKEDRFEIPDGKYVLGVIERKLLKNGLLAADKPENADVLVYPVVAHGAIDGSSMLIGVPELPVALPGVGSISLPELALFKHQSQFGRNRMSVYVVDALTGHLLATTPTVSSERQYHRWTLAFFITWRTTDLVSPF